MAMAGEELERKGSTRYSACLRCTQSCYRTHGDGKRNFDAGSSSFFKVMLNGFSEKLKIPSKFVDQVKDQMGPDIILEGPSGQLWHATLSCMGTGMTIEHGWKKFVSDHAIELGDFLVFKHSGKSHFIVQIFGRSGCEKQSAFIVTSMEFETEKLNPEKQGDKMKNTQNPSFIVTELSVGNEYKIKEVTIERLDTCMTDSAQCTAIPNDKIYTCSAAPKRYEGLHQKPAYYFESTRPESSASPSECRKISKMGKPVKGVERLMSVLSSDDKMKIQEFNSQMKKSKIFVSKKIPKQPGIQKAVNEAMLHKIRNPALLIVLRRSHVCSGGFRISFPLSFTRTWFPNYEVEFTLLGPDKQKSPVTFPGNNMKQQYIKGWRNFAGHYNLKQEDICIFELVNKKLLTFKVHLFRKADRLSSGRKGGISEMEHEISRIRDCSISTKVKSHEIQVKIEPKEEFSRNVPVISPGANHHVEILKWGQCRLGLLMPGYQEAKESLDCSGQGHKKFCFLRRETKNDDFITDCHVYSANENSSEVMPYDTSDENRTRCVLSKRNKLLNDGRDHTPTFMMDEKPYFLRGKRHKRLTMTNAGVSCKSGIQTAARKRDLRCSDAIELE